MKENPILSMTMSLSRKVSDGNYGSWDVFVAVSGITADTTDAELDYLIETQGAMAYPKLVASLQAKIKEKKAAA